MTTMEKTTYIVTLRDIDNAHSFASKAKALKFAKAVASDHGGAGVYIKPIDERFAGNRDYIAAWDRDGKRIAV
jgi:hypothetical protein